MTTEEIQAYHIDDQARFALPPGRTTYTASVKVMRSHDYCHFEISLGSTEPLTLAGVDAMRKEAARLADKAVEQYKIAKENALRCGIDRDNLERLRRRAKSVGEIPEHERTPQQQAEIKAFQDALFHIRRSYDYEDDWRQDYEDDDDDDQDNY